MQPSVHVSKRRAAFHLGMWLAITFAIFTHTEQAAWAQEISGDATAGISESGGLALSNALAAASLDPSTGVLSASLPIETPAARGSSQPGLALLYNSMAGFGEAGIGWGLNIPVIERHGPTGGVPNYNNLDPSQSPSSLGVRNLDTFTFNGARLWPLCIIKEDCSPATLASLPSWAEPGAVYFRLEADTTRARFFWSADRTRWRVQFVGGEILELGVPTLAPNLFPDERDAAIDYDTGRTTDYRRRPFRWNAVRKFGPETQKAGANFVAFRWARLGGRGLAYLTDVFDTPAADAPSDSTFNNANFAHHVRIIWDKPPFLRGRAIAPFRASPDLRMVRIDISSSSFESRSRSLLRRYHLAYESIGNRYYLKSYELEGRCAAIREQSDGSLQETKCGRLPGTNLTYSQRRNNTIPAVFEHPALAHEKNKPAPFTVLDVDADSLPDLLETKAGLPPPPSQVVYFNGFDWTESKITDASNSPLFSSIGTTVTTSTSRYAKGATAVWLGTFNPSGTVSYLALERHALQNPATKAWNWTAWDSTDEVLGLPNSAWRTAGFGDINGDGRLEQVLMLDPSGSGPTPTVTDWQQMGAVLAMPLGSRQKLDYAFVDCSGPSPSKVQSFEWPDGSTASAIVDLNGDGLGDLAYVTRETSGVNVQIGVRYWPGDGSGGFWACTNGPCTCTDKLHEASSIRFANIELPKDEGALVVSASVGLADVDADGFADLVVTTPDSVLVFRNADGDHWGDLTASNLNIRGSQVDADWREFWPPRMTFADMNANGVTDIVFTVGGHIRYIDTETFLSWPIGITRPGLLTQIDNGRGAVTKIEYESTGVLAKFVRSGEPSWKLPQVQYVVKNIEVSSGLPGELPTSRQYFYESPIYSARERRFKGFEKVHVDSEYVRETLTYYVGASVRDDGYAYKGSLLLADETTSHASGHPASSTVIKSYKTGTDEFYQHDLVSDNGSGSHMTALVEAVDTYLYDTTAAQNSSESVSAVVSSPSAERNFVAAVPLRSATYAHLRSTYAWDYRGSLVEAVDHGRVLPGDKPLDSAIRRVIEYVPLDGEWRFLQKNLRVDGFASLPNLDIPDEAPRVRAFEYDSLGRLSSVYAELIGTLPLDRRHVDPTRNVAPAPPFASKDGIIRLLHNDFDVFGNVVGSQGPAGACAATSYDKEYAQLSVGEAQFISGCSGPALRSSTVWDRGFAVAVRHSVADGATTAYDLDMFGRTVGIHEPDEISGAPSSAPTVATIYHDKPGGPVQQIEELRRSAPGVTHASWTYLDAFGRKLLVLEQADPTMGDAGDWVASGLPTMKFGLVIAQRRPWFFSGDPANHSLSEPVAPSVRFTYDSFGRLSETYHEDGSLARRRTYGPLSVSEADSEDRSSSFYLNGHGQVRQSILTTATDQVRTDYEFQAASKPVYVVQARSPRAGGVTGPTTGGVVRRMQYDSLGRLVLNAEPNASTLMGSPAGHAWRYAYDDAGHVVGTSDARGCGKNISYDGIGRPTLEDFSPCLAAHADYSEMIAATGEGAEVQRIYDNPEPGQPSGRFGRLTAVRDRASHTRFEYDGRGRLTTLSRRIRRPSDVLTEGSSLGAGGGIGQSHRDAEDERFHDLRWLLAGVAGLLAVSLRVSAMAAGFRRRSALTSAMSLGSLLLFVTACSGSHADGMIRLGSSAGALSDASYEGRWNRRVFTYDDASRVVSATTGADVPELMGLGGESKVTTSYSRRGAVLTQAGSYGNLLGGQTFASDGQVLTRSYNDAASTQISAEYDLRGRLQQYSIARASAGPWTASPGYMPPAAASESLQELLLASQFAYDGAGRLKTIEDHRSPGEWKEGFAPVDREIAYDTFDRVARVDYTYHGSAVWQDPSANAPNTSPGPVPVVASPNRVGWQTFQYDWRGNLILSADDASLLYDRSLGVVGHGGAAEGPDQLRTAGPGVTAAYDEAGNMLDLVAHRPGPCNDPSGCNQRFHYDWDEVGQLARARRWDLDGVGDIGLLPALLATASAVDINYDYDAFGTRVLKEVQSSFNDERHFTAEIFPSLRLEATTWDAIGGIYRREPETEVVYLAGFGRLVYGPTLPAAATTTALHVLLTLPDHLGSGAAVIDRDTGELVERTTQQAYGTLESDYRPARWQGLREAYQFTGKEADSAVGLTYFGARYYNASLGRFISPDPLTIHAFQGDSNPYAYVGGAVLSATDPFGLSCAGSIGAEVCPGDVVGWGGMEPPGTDYGVFVSSPGSAGGTSPGVAGMRAPPSAPTDFSGTGGPLGTGLNPSNPARARALRATVPDDVADHDIPLGTGRQFAVAAWNGSMEMGLISRYLMVADDDEPSWASAAGSVVPMIGMVALGGAAGEAGLSGSEVSARGLAAGEAGELVHGGGQVLRHYTDGAGFQAIMESGMIRSPASGATAGRVFATEFTGNAEAVESRIFSNFSTHAGRGSHVIEFAPRQGVAFELGKPGEVFYRGGALRFGRQIEINFAGPNPY